MPCLCYGYAVDMHETYCVLLKDGTFDPPQLLLYTFIQPSQRQKKIQIIHELKDK